MHLQAQGEEAADNNRVFRNWSGSWPKIPNKNWRPLWDLCLSRNQLKKRNLFVRKKYWLVGCLIVKTTWDTNFESFYLLINTSKGNNKDLLDINQLTRMGSITNHVMAMTGLTLLHPKHRNWNPLSKSVVPPRRPCPSRRKPQRQYRTSTHDDLIRKKSDSWTTWRIARF